MSFIEARSVYKTYDMGEIKIDALNDVSFDINEGELCMIVGDSGAGKTTMLNILGGIDECTEGTVKIAGEFINQFNAKKLTEYRRYDVGFVFQFYNLIPNLTALENVELASQICDRASNPVEVLESVGLGDKMNNFPSQLSGGEQQRVAIARALAKNPKLLLCDEPTGALDSRTGKQIMELLQSTCIQRKMTEVIITHNLALQDMADRIITMKNGQISKIEINRNPLKASYINW
jgi:putative ABC transport system ATP-binding protein